jgi:ABC-type multidrug transport system, ATPase and permease components
VQNATEKMMKKCTVFMVAHRLSTIQRADKIAFMKEGSISEIGSYKELMYRKGDFYKLKMLQN